MTGPADIVLVTSQGWPTLSASDALLADELARRGHRVRSHPWNGTSIEAFTTADVVVLRSNWDYHHDLDAFVDWLVAVDGSDAVLHNPAGLVRPLLDKTYLTDLEAAGFRTPQTLVVDEPVPGDVRQWMGERALDRAVVKPAWGASGHGVELVGVDGLDDLARRWRQDPTRRPMLIQEFVPEVADGEVALVSFAGRFSHALLRKAAAGDFRVNATYGGSMSSLDEVDPRLVEFGAKVEAALPERATYVRIDVVAGATGPIVMEVEVNEPALGLDLAPGSAARFADALLG